MNTNFQSTKPLAEHISPEGVEERIVKEQRFLMTQTAGGKFRVYVSCDGKMQSYAIADQESKALETFGGAMMVMGGLIVDAKKTISHLLDGLIKPGA